MIAKFDKWGSLATTLMFCLTTVGAVVLAASATLDTSIDVPKSQPRRIYAVSGRPFDTGSRFALLLRIRDDGDASISLDESSNGSTVQASPGQAIELTLHSTYWKIQPSSNSSVVALVAEPSSTSADPRACPPGAGCGGVHAAFAARAPGTATISASRSVCGEALPCRANQRSFSVTILVR
jgi:hypothetical protein